VSPHVSPRNVPDRRRGTVGGGFARIGKRSGPGGSRRVPGLSFTGCAGGPFFAQPHFPTPERRCWRGYRRGSECNARGNGQRAAGGGDATLRRHRSHPRRKEWTAVRRERCKSRRLGFAKARE